MSTASMSFGDSAIMLRRNFKHILRNPVTIFNGALMPVVIMFLFVYVIGGAFNVGERYIDYATPGMILLAITYGLSGTAVSVSSDMAKGIFLVLFEFSGCLFIFDICLASKYIR